MQRYLIIIIIIHFRHINYYKSITERVESLSISLSIKKVGSPFLFYYQHDFRGRKFRIFEQLFNQLCLQQTLCSIMRT